MQRLKINPLASISKNSQCLPKLHGVIGAQSPFEAKAALAMHKETPSLILGMINDGDVGGSIGRTGGAKNCSCTKSLMDRQILRLRILMLSPFLIHLVPICFLYRWQVWLPVSQIDITFLLRTVSSEDLQLNWWLEMLHATMLVPNPP